MPIAPSTYYLHAARNKNPDLRSNRAKQDETLSQAIRRVWEESFQNYGAVKVWHPLKQEGLAVARCTVERLMKKLGLKGVRRGKAIKTTISDADAACPLDRVNRPFSAERPNALWVADFTYVKTWQGFVYVAFVIDVFARYIVGWKVSSSAHTDFVLDALEQALHDRQPSVTVISFTIVTVACSTFRFAIPNVWQKPALRHPWVVSVILMTMP